MRTRAARTKATNALVAGRYAFDPMNGAGYQTRRAVIKALRAFQRHCATCRTTRSDTCFASLASREPRTGDRLRGGRLPARYPATKKPTSRPISTPPSRPIQVHHPAPGTRHGGNSFRRVPGTRQCAQVTTGTPITLVIENVDQRSKDDADPRQVPSGPLRLHLFVKYGVRDYRGGGRQSARATRAGRAGAARNLAAPESRCPRRAGPYGTKRITLPMELDGTRKNNPFFLSRRPKRVC